MMINCTFVPASAFTIILYINRSSRHYAQGEWRLQILMIFLNFAQNWENLAENSFFILANRSYVTKIAQNLSWWSLKHGKNTRILSAFHCKSLKTAEKIIKVLVFSNQPLICLKVMVRKKVTHHILADDSVFALKVHQDVGTQFTHIHTRTEIVWQMRGHRKIPSRNNF